MSMTDFIIAYSDPRYFDPENDEFNPEMILAYIVMFIQYFELYQPKKQAKIIRQLKFILFRCEKYLREPNWEIWGGGKGHTISDARYEKLGDLISRFYGYCIEIWTDEMLAGNCKYDRRFDGILWFTMHIAKIKAGVVYSSINPWH